MAGHKFADFESCKHAVVIAQLGQKEMAADLTGKKRLFL